MHASLVPGYVGRTFTPRTSTDSTKQSDADSFHTQVQRRAQRRWHANASWTTSQIWAIQLSIEFQLANVEGVGVASARVTANADQLE